MTPRKTSAFLFFSLLVSSSYHYWCIFLWTLQRKYSKIWPGEKQSWSLTTFVYCTWVSYVAIFYWGAGLYLRLWWVSTMLWLSIPLILITGYTFLFHLFCSDPKVRILQYALHEGDETIIQIALFNTKDMSAFITLYFNCYSDSDIMKQHRSYSHRFQNINFIVPPSIQ